MLSRTIKDLYGRTDLAIPVLRYKNVEDVNSVPGKEAGK
jgi:hypothetical protein